MGQQEGKLKKQKLTPQDKGELRKQLKEDCSHGILQRVWPAS